MLQKRKSAQECSRCGIVLQNRKSAQRVPSAIGTGLITCPTLKIHGSVHGSRVNVSCFFFSSKNCLIYHSFKTNYYIIRSQVIQQALLSFLIPFPLLWIKCDQMFAVEKVCHFPVGFSPVICFSSETHQCV